MNTEYSNIMKSRILEAAKRVFISQSYDASTMTDVAVEAGISPAVLKYYFRNKEMIFEAIFIQLVELILPCIGNIAKDKSTIMEKLPQLIDIYVLALKLNPLLPLFIIVEMNRDPQRLFASIMRVADFEETLGPLSAQIEKEMKEGLIREMKFVDMVSTFIGLLIFPLLANSMIIENLMNGNPASFNDYVATRRDSILATLTSLLSPDSDMPLPSDPAFNV